VGFSDGGPSRDEDDDPATVGEITTFYFLAEAWGTGAAPALMERVLAELRGRGFSECTLWVLRDNPRAVRFYERAGFSLDGAEKTVEIGGKPLTEVRYRRSLGRERP
jgi:ribosomal protein S18 acetylase RimI-like enzyme